MRDITKFLGACALLVLASAASAESWAPSVAAVLTGGPQGLVVAVGRPVPNQPGYRHPGRPGHPGNHGQIVVERSQPHWDRRRVQWSLNNRVAELRRRGVRVLNEGVYRTHRGFHWEIRYRRWR